MPIYTKYVWQTVAAIVPSFGNVVLERPQALQLDLTLVSIGDDPSGLTVTLVKAGAYNRVSLAVTAVRNLAGCPAASWTNLVAPGAEIKKGRYY